MILLHDDDIGKWLDWPTLIEALREGHKRGVDVVERLLLSEEEGRRAGAANHLLIWSAWRFGAYCGAKLVTVFPENRGGLATNATVYVLFDGKEGRPLATIESSEFTLRKTAADSALGASYLARRDAHSLLVIGAGGQAYSQVQALRAVRPSIREVRIWNRTTEKAKALAARLARGGVAAEVVEDLSIAVPSASIISMLTAAMSPLLDGTKLSPGTHVDLVGSFTPTMRETDDETVRRASLFVDTRRFTLEVTGDLAIPLAAGVIRESDILADLFELARGDHPGRQSPQEITLFKNGGGGHLDLMTAIAAYERARPGTAASSAFV
ncbi:MAG: dehydrogenase [Hyphomicrobiales bacterium]|nr:dehydrogenase [Hyphomicrobiales bacterium]